MDTYSEPVSEHTQRAEDREPRPDRPRGLRRLHAPGLGRPRARPAPPPGRRRRGRARRAALAETFPGERLVIPAGGFKVRANDTDYRFRPDTAHTYLTGNQTSDAVLVVEDGEAILYARPRSSRQTDEFFRDRQYGELWAGRRPSLHEISDSLGMPMRHLDDLADVLRGSAKTRVLRGVDAAGGRRGRADEGRDHDLARVLSELRLVKDEWEIGAARRRPATSPRSASRTPSASGTTCSSSASAGSRARSSAGPARWATTSATTRSSAAGRTRRRCTGPRTPARSRPASCCCSTWASRAATSTPPT